MLVVGGSASALFAALHAAREGASTCLVEPTDWVGGQLTAGGVPAVDFAWRENAQGINAKAAHKERCNNHYEFHDWLQTIGNPGDCTVSRHCFLPRGLLDGPIAEAVRRESNLSVFLNVVPIAVETETNGGKREISRVAAVQRFPKASGKFAGHERELSAAIGDWYSPRPTAFFDKRRLSFGPREGRKMMVVEASEFGDALALSNARYLVGEDGFEGSARQWHSGCGQSFTAVFNLSIAKKAPNAGSWSAAGAPQDHEFSFGSYDWSKVWRYRRLKGNGAPDIGQISAMNWKQGNINNGNDYADRHLFLPHEAARKTVEQGRWRGGVDTEALEGAERLSRHFYSWFASQAPTAFRGLIHVDTESVGTRHGFYKFPYLRESRRSVGHGGFLLCAWDLSFFPGPTGFPFADRVATTLYDYDIHALNGCGARTEEADVYWRKHPKPFYLPLRAFSNDTVANLVVAGKCMAQSFLANAATRLHPGEVVSGTAAGVIAAHCSRMAASMHQLIESMDFKEVQKKVSRYQPLEWKIGGETFPKDGRKPAKIAFGFGNPHGWDVEWADSLRAYHDRDFLYFPIPDREIESLAEKIKRKSAAPPSFEKVSRSGGRFLKCLKKTGFEALSLKFAKTSR